MMMKGDIVSIWNSEPGEAPVTNVDQDNNAK